MSGTRRNFNFFPRGDGAAFGLTRPAHPFASQKGQKNFLKREVGREGGGSEDTDDSPSFGGRRRERGCAVDIRARHRQARYNAPRAHFISYCRELRHGTAELDVRELAEQATEREPNGR